MLLLVLLLVQFYASAQNCNCPPIASCGPCQGGFSSVTLRYNGLIAVAVTARDGQHQLYTNLLMFSGTVFTVTGSHPGGNFHANTLTVYISGLPNFTIDTDCNSTAKVNQTKGLFTIVGITSKEGGTLCCDAPYQDSIKPTIVNCPSNIEVSLGSSCSTPVDWIEPTVWDNCGNVVVTKSHEPNDLFTKGTTTVVYTATDDFGNIETCSFDVVVIDDTDPVIDNCPADIYVDASAGCATEVHWTEPTASDNCFVETFTQSHLPGHYFDPGTTTVTYTATDKDGNSATCSFNVIVTDVTPPVFTGCPSDITASANATCSANVSWTAPVPSDNCSAVVSSSHTSGDSFPLGTTTVTYTATDGNGNTVTCSFDVTVVDDTDPVITGCPSDITVNADASCSAIVDWTAPVASDNCSGFTFVPTHSPNSSFPLGTTTVTYTATDVGGNVVTCSFDVTVVDNSKPVFTSCPTDITVSADALCNATANWTEPVATDNCPGISTSRSHAPNSAFPIGTTTVTYTATDAAGNIETCSFDVTVIDDTPPVIVNCPADITVPADASCTAFVDWTAPAASDNCTLSDFTSDQTPGNFGIGTTIVTYTAVDAAGNETQCSFNVIVEDRTYPTITGCPSDIVVSANADCEAVVSWSEPNASDNCGGITLDRSHSPNTTFGLGTTVVTYTATDGSSNIKTCSFNVIVEDKTDPVITGCPSDIVAAATSSCTAIVSWTEPAASDNCGVHPMTSTHSSGSAFPVGATTVTYTAEDINGNTSTCSFNVTVNDEAAPVFSGCVPSDIIVHADASCQSGAHWAEPTAIDNCGVTNLTKSHSPNDVFPIGTTKVTYTATDAAGNTAVCEFNVVVVDEAAPVFSGCIASDIIVDAVDACSANATWTPPTVSDNCGVTNFSSTHDPDNIFPIGTTVVTYTAEDAAGNISTCSFNVIVRDRGLPEFSGCIDSDIVVVANASCQAEVMWTPPVASDLCSAVVRSSTHDPGHIFSLGTEVVTYTAEDAAGNIATCSFKVIVVDETAPVFTGCVTNDIVVTADGSCGKSVSWTQPTATDNCGLPMVTSNYSPDDEFPVGTTQVTYRAADASGNFVTCSFNVVVVDQSDPVFTFCPSPQQAVATTTCTATVSWTPPVATDNCGTVILTSTHEPGSAFPLGSTTVTYTATDAAGNTAQCSFDVLVKDEGDPVFASCPDIVINANSTCEAVANWATPSVLDCSAVTLSSTHNSGDTFPLGSTTVVYTATDIHGNSTSCSFNVVVKDGTEPNFQQCPTDIHVDVTQACEQVVTWSEPTAFDNCSVASTARSHEPGSLFQLGTTVVTYSAIDDAGNVATCQFKVVLAYKGVPTITGCPEDMEITGDENGEAFTTWTPPAASVPCGEITLTGSHEPGIYLSLGTTTVSYRAEDAFGNTANCSFNVTVVPDLIDIGIGKLITPDGNGQNDEWAIVNIERYPNNKIVVVDRWGGVVFSASGYNNTGVVWNGTNRNGDSLPTGTYFYTVSIRYGSRTVEKTGFVELIR